DDAAAGALLRRVDHAHRGNHRGDLLLTRKVRRRHRLDPVGPQHQRQQPNHACLPSQPPARPANSAAPLQSLMPSKAAIRLQPTTTPRSRGPCGRNSFPGTRIRTVRRELALCLIGFAVLSPGCSLVSTATHNLVTETQRCTTDYVEGVRERRLA